MAVITVNELAETLETSTRTTRKFLRSITPQGEQPGRGARWQIEKRDVRSLKTKFTKFLEEHTRKVDEVDASTDDVPETDDELYALIDAATE